MFLIPKEPSQEGLWPWAIVCCRWTYNADLCTRSELIALQCIESKKMSTSMLTKDIVHFFNQAFVLLPKAFPETRNCFLRLNKFSFHIDCMLGRISNIIHCVFIHWNCTIPWLVFITKVENRGIYEIWYDRIPKHRTDLSLRLLRINLHHIHWFSPQSISRMTNMGMNNYKSAYDLCLFPFPFPTPKSLANKTLWRS